MGPLAVVACILTLGCAGPDGSTGDDAAGDPATLEAPGRSMAAAGGAGNAGDALSRTLSRSEAFGDSIEDLLRPVPLMRPAEEASLKRYSNAANLERARRFGLRVSGDADIQQAVADGRLVRLPDSTRHWVIRELGASRPYVTPGTRELLERIGERFQARLDEMGLPPLRFEISSVLRTAATQAALRQRNVNAAAGRSAHEFGTTVDIPYSGYAAPAELPDGLLSDASNAPDGRRADLERVARYAIERMAARKSRELKAILGDVLREAQSEGLVLVTLEELQPVYHITLARDLSG